MKTRNRLIIAVRGMRRVTANQNGGNLRVILPPSHPSFLPVLLLLSLVEGHRHCMSAPSVVSLAALVKCNQTSSLLSRPPKVAVRSTPTPSSAAKQLAHNYETFLSRLCVRKVQVLGAALGCKAIMC